MPPPDSVVRCHRGFMRARLHRTRNGFTLIEVLGIVVVIGILSAVAVSRWLLYEKGLRLDAQGRALLDEVALARAKALKNDQAYRFEFKGNGYLIAEDRNGNGSTDSDEIVSRNELALGVAYGAPAGGPQTGPEDQGSPVNRIEGAWKDALVVDHDRVATINPGSVYLFAAGSPRVVCLRMPVTGRQVDMWRWEGSEWIRM